MRKRRMERGGGGRVNKGGGRGSWGGGRGWEIAFLCGGLRGIVLIEVLGDHIAHPSNFQTAVPWMGERLHLALSQKLSLRILTVSQ